MTTLTFSFNFFWFCVDSTHSHKMCYQCYVFLRRWTINYAFIKTLKNIFRSPRKRYPSVFFNNLQCTSIPISLKHWLNWCKYILYLAYICKPLITLNHEIPNILEFSLRFNKINCSSSNRLGKNKSTVAIGFCLASCSPFQICPWFFS